MEYDDERLMEVLIGLRLGETPDMYGLTLTLRHLEGLSYKEFIDKYASVELDPEDDTVDPYDEYSKSDIQIMRNKLNNILDGKIDDPKIIERLEKVEQQDIYKVHFTVKKELFVNGKVISLMRHKDQLGDYVLDIIEDYMKSLGITDTRDEFLSRLSDADLKNHRSHREQLLSIGGMVGSWSSAVTKPESREGCTKHCISVTHNEHDLGGIIVYNNKAKSILFRGGKTSMIQNIVKFTVPTLVQILYPEVSYLIPKINTALEIPITMVCEMQKSQYIVVRPLSNQARILEKYYGYQMITEPFPDVVDGAPKGKKSFDDDPDYPCDTMAHGFQPWYYKAVPQ